MMINIISKEDNSYRVRIGGITHFTCFGGKEEETSDLQTSTLCVPIAWCKVDYNIDKFIHAPTLTNNEVM